MEIMTINNVRTYMENEKVFLNLEDVARGLGVVQIKNGKEYIRWETIIKYCEEFSQPVGKDSYIPENIFYKLCMKANNEVARRFQELVCDEILPSIRKHGVYATDKLLEDPDLLIGALQKLKEERERNKYLAETIEYQKPKVLFAETIETAQSSILVGELAKLIKQSGVDIGAVRLFSWMRDNGFLIRRNGSEFNMPTQKAMDLKLFEIKEGTRVSSNGSIKITKTPKVTGKGQIYFVNKFLEFSNSQGAEILQ